MALLVSALACAGPTGSPTGTEDGLRAALATYDSAWLAKDSVVIARARQVKSREKERSMGDSDLFVWWWNVTAVGAQTNHPRLTPLRATTIARTPHATAGFRSHCLSASSA